MLKTLMLGLTLLCSAAWLQAQDQSPQNPPNSPNSSNGSSQTSVKGCLQGSGGNFTLTDQSGTTYQLQGETSNLTDHVGHEVQITGTTSAGSGGGANTSQGSSQGGSQGSSQPMLTVEKVKHISKTCKSMSK